MRLILVRHGETQLNKDGRIQGTNHTPLNATGRAQAHALAAALATDQPFRLYTSPLARAMETAQVISETNQLALTPLRGLEEIDAGELMGLSGQELRQRYPEFMRRWDRDPGTVQMPGGESLLQVEERASRAVRELTEKHPDVTVVTVTHNFPIQTIICKVLDMPLNNFRRLRPALGSITRLEFSHNQGILVSLNETWHLHTENDD